MLTFISAWPRLSNWKEITSPYSGRSRVTSLALAKVGHYTPWRSPQRLLPGFMLISLIMDWVRLLRIWHWYVHANYPEQRDTSPALSRLSLVLCIPVSFLKNHFRVHSAIQNPVDAFCIGRVVAATNYFELSTSSMFISTMIQRSLLSSEPITYCTSQGCYWACASSCQQDKLLKLPAFWVWVSILHSWYSTITSLWQ